MILHHFREVEINKQEEHTFFFQSLMIIIVCNYCCFCFRTKTSYKLSLFEVDKRLTVAYTRRDKNIHYVLFISIKEEQSTGDAARTRAEISWAGFK